ncbi:ABC transporter permease subunit [Paraburkholderia phosphatilytica]|uniref:ABC transporter permease subunit n=1 Tax=Paraburkholderia phosphatilytica TaxID=2282883 RepID=UPI000E53C2E3|nr:ABC transporter permease subunit [Paraburkholderia phosphatilytica]
MLLWTRWARVSTWSFAALLFVAIYGLPVAMIALASVSGQWNGILPSHLTLSHYTRILHSESLDQLRVSVTTGAVASAAALVAGTWSALALRQFKGTPSRILNVVFFLPSAVPSVSIGLGLLVAFSQRPLLLNGTATIVFVAHFLLISAFTYGNVSAGLARFAPEYGEVAESLGARPLYKLTRVTLPLVAPYLLAAFSLSFALSMGELGATLMIYPPGWVTLPVGIFALSDRGAIFDAATLTMVLGGGTLLVLLALSRVSSRAAVR